MSDDAVTMSVEKYEALSDDISQEDEGKKSTSRGLRSTIFAHPFRILIACLLVIGIGGSLTYMLALWDPAPYLPKATMAVVNEDVAQPYNGSTTRFGDDIVEGFNDTDYLDFKEVSRDEADEGLVTNKYLFTVYIPSDFTEKILTVMSDAPQQPTVDIRYNDYYGTASGFLTSSVVPQIKDQIEKTFINSYAKTVLEGINSLNDGLNSAASGSAELSKGLDSLADATDQLVTASGTLSDGSQQLASGADALVEGSEALGEGAAAVHQGVQALNQLLIPVLQNIQSLTPQLNSIISLLESVGQNAQAEQVQQFVTLLDDNSPNNMITMLDQLESGAELVAHNLKDSDGEYRQGVDAVAQGVHTVADGNTALADGLSQFKTGVDTLHNGAGMMYFSLSMGLAQAPSITDMDGSQRQIAEPILFNETNMHPTKTIVNAEDPTVKALSSGSAGLILPVFGLFFMLVTAIALPIGRRPGWFAMALIGGNAVITIVLTVLSTMLGFAPASWWVMAGVLVLMTLAYSALLGFIRFATSTMRLSRLWAALISLTIFVFSCFAFGGIWPIQLTPAAFAWLHNIVPMTFVRYAFIRATDGVFDATFALGVVGMLITAIVCSALYIAWGIMLRKRRAQGYTSERGSEAALSSLDGYIRV